MIITRSKKERRRNANILIFTLQIVSQLKNDYHKIDDLAQWQQLVMTVNFSSVRVVFFVTHNQFIDKNPRWEIAHPLCIRMNGNNFKVEEINAKAKER